MKKEEPVAVVGAKRKVGRPRKVIVVEPAPEKKLGWGDKISEFLACPRFTSTLFYKINLYLKTAPPEGKVFNKDLMKTCQTFSIEEMKKEYPLILEKKSALPSVTRKWINFLMSESIRKVIEYYEKN